MRHLACYQETLKDVKVDTSNLENRVWFKVQHEPEHFQAVADASLESVRIFMPFESNEAHSENALHHNLALVVCMWGFSSWSNINVTEGAKQMV